MSHEISINWNRGRGISKWTMAWKKKQQKKKWAVCTDRHTHDDAVVERRKSTFLSMSWNRKKRKDVNVCFVFSNNAVVKALEREEIGLEVQSFQHQILLPFVGYERDDCWEITGAGVGDIDVLVDIARRCNLFSFCDVIPRIRLEWVCRLVTGLEEGWGRDTRSAPSRSSLPLIFNLPARFDWSIIGWTIRRLALINLNIHSKIKQREILSFVAWRLKVAY